MSLFDDSKQQSPSVFALAANMAHARGQLRDFSVPVNPYFPTPELLQALRGRVEAIAHFPPSPAEEIALHLADFAGLPPETIVVGDGSTELITWICRLLVSDAVAIPVPAFVRWSEDPTLSGKAVRTFPCDPRQDFRISPGELVAGVLRAGARAAVLCNPNNPTGALMGRADVLRALEALSDLDVVIIDESFIDFADENEVPSVDRDVANYPNAVVLKSLGKNLGLHGLRIGYAVANPELSARLRSALPTWTPSPVAQALVEELADARGAYEAARRHVVRDRLYLEERLRRVPGLVVYPSQASYVYVRAPEGIDGAALRDYLLIEHGCLLRDCGNQLGSDSRHFRIAARPPADTDFLGECLDRTFAELGIDAHPEAHRTAVIWSTTPPAPAPEAMPTPPPEAMPTPPPVAALPTPPLEAMPTPPPVAALPTPPLEEMPTPPPEGVRLPAPEAPPIMTALTALAAPEAPAAPEAVAPAPAPEPPPPVAAAPIPVAAPAAVEAATVAAEKPAAAVDKPAPAADKPAAAPEKPARAAEPAAAPAAPAPEPILFAPVPPPPPLHAPRRPPTVAVVAVVVLGIAVGTLFATRSSRPRGSVASSPVAGAAAPAPAAAPPAHEEAPAEPVQHAAAADAPAAAAAAEVPPAPRADSDESKTRRVARSGKGRHRRLHGHLGAHRGQVANH